MKKYFNLLICILFITTVKSFAQITITSSDVQSYFTIGKILHISDDTSTTSLNIGDTGATSWDFSGLHSDSLINIHIVKPSGTPFGNNFPAATFSNSDTVIVSGYPAEQWQFYSVNNALLYYGFSGHGNAGGFQITAISHNNPAAKNLVLPLNMGTNWTEDFVRTDSTIISQLPPSVSYTNIHDENTVDAYGSMTLPGGDTVQALRVRTDIWTYTSTNGGYLYNRTISYLFLSTNGTQVLVDAADTTSPSTGVIPVSDITFINATVTDVPNANNTIPDNFNLEQNYPNPFNPTTIINFSIPKLSLVTIKVYDILGNEIATLVNEEKPAGTYEITWNAANLPSGIYFYRMDAGSFISTKKLILLK
ncbi:MAG TPA: T9SS type A sorting domain-containing protein [Ignavibacteriaceae bacterium]|nr:T9SS type A sorting domain-containing protein [Ignavibacteriaceae bacterium]